MAFSDDKHWCMMSQIRSFDLRGAQYWSFNLQARHWPPRFVIRK